MRNVIIIVSLILSSLAYGQVEHVWLTTQMLGRHSLGGGDSTTIWGYGYDSLGVITLPAPLLEFDEGDSVTIHMINDSPESHTIHLHGLDVDQANDGVPSTSFFVISNDTGHYSFRASEVGGYLYHCHVTTTLHLTMGMYGMIGVNAPGDQVYPGGPIYDKKYHFLASDLEVATNDAPLLAFPFNEIVPDHFMINGKAGFELGGDSTNIVFAEDGEDVLLRLGSMAYSRAVFNFPPETNAVVHMSDGRVLPASFPALDLELYPGERFSVLLSPDSGYVGVIQVDYYSMLNGQLVGTNLIGVNRTDLSIDEETILDNISLLVYPNPAPSFVDIEISNNQEQITWFSPEGKLIARRNCRKGTCRFHTARLSPGVYLVQSSSGRTARVLVP